MAFNKQKEPRNLIQIISELTAVESLPLEQRLTCAELFQFLRQYSIEITREEFMSFGNNPTKGKDIQIYAIDDLDLKPQLPFAINFDLVPLAKLRYFITAKNIWVQLLPYLKAIRQDQINSRTNRPEISAQKPPTAEEMLQNAEKLLSRINARQEP